MKTEERFNLFKKEYEKLCKKYQMHFEAVDLWELGYERIEVYDEKEKQFIAD